MDETHQWIIGTALGLFGALFIFFWKLYQHHHRRMDDFKKENNKSHGEIHKKIDETDNKSQQRHSLLRDKIEQLLLLMRKD